MMNKKLFYLIGLFILTTSCKPPFQKKIDINYFKGYALQYISEICNDQREIEIPDKGKVKIKIYIEQIKNNHFYIWGDIFTISDENRPTEFDKICVDGDCYDLFLFMKNREKEKDISEFYDEYQKFSSSYPYISTHFPKYKYDISRDPPKVERIY